MTQRETILKSEQDGIVTGSITVSNTSDGRIGVMTQDSKGRGFWVYLTPKKAEELESILIMYENDLMEESQ